MSGRDRHAGPRQNCPGIVPPPGAIVAEEMLTSMSMLGWLDALIARMHGQCVAPDDSFEEVVHA